jgi:MobA/MobL family
VSAAGFYHCSVKGVGRHDGRSIVAAAAYRAGQRLKDERTGEIFAFERRGGVLDSFIFLPGKAPAWARRRARLWNEAERAEPRANGRLATELELALPHELTPAQRKQLLKDFLAPIIVHYRVTADVALHAPGKESDHRGFHAHVLLTHRELGADGFGEIADTRIIMRKRKGQPVEEKIAGIAATPADVRAIRKAWEQAVNCAYEQAGLDIRVDHRSHEDRGIGQEPTRHLGPIATGMERRGVPTERGGLNRAIQQRNHARQEARSLEAEVAAIKARIRQAEAHHEFAPVNVPATETPSPTLTAVTMTAQLAPEPESPLAPHAAGVILRQQHQQPAGRDGQVFEAAWDAGAEIAGAALPVYDLPAHAPPQFPAPALVQQNHAARTDIRIDVSRITPGAAQQEQAREEQAPAVKAQEPRPSVAQQQEPGPELRGGPASSVEIALVKSDPAAPARQDGKQPATGPPARRFAPGIIKQRFQEFKQAFNPKPARPEPAPKKRKRSGETRGGFRRAALQIGTLARALFLHYISPVFDEALSIHLWHENNQHGATGETDLRQQTAPNHLSLDL